VAGSVTVRLHANDQDLTRRFNRTENIRPIPPSDPDFARLYARRNNAESINRNLEDTLLSGRDHARDSDLPWARTPPTPKLYGSPSPRR
jgi:hypothetical protein